MASRPAGVAWSSAPLTGTDKLTPADLMDVLTKTTEHTRDPLAPLRRRATLVTIQPLEQVRAAALLTLTAWRDNGPAPKVLLSLILPAMLIAATWA